MQSRNWARAIVCTLAVNSGFAALAFVPGVSKDYVILAGGFLLLVANFTTATGWSLPDLPARIVNGTLLLLLIIEAGLGSPGGRVAVPKVAHIVIALLVVRMLQRKRPQDDLLLLLGAGVCFGLASFRGTSPIFLPLLLVGVLSCALGTYLLLIGGEESATRKRGIPVVRHAFGHRARHVIEVGIVGARLIALMLLVTVAVFILIPRAVPPDDAETEMMDASLNMEPNLREAAPDRPVSRVGFAETIDITESGIVKQDERIALEIQVYRDGRRIRLEPDQTYFRGRVLSHFDGRAWSTRLLLKRRERTQSAGGLVEIAPRPGNVHVLRQVVSIASPMPGTAALFALYRPWRVDPAGASEILVDASDAMQAPQRHVDKTRYDVLSLIPRPGVPDPWAEILNSEERRVYTALPAGCDRIGRLAGEIVDGATGKAAAHRLCDHLRNPSLYRYTLDRPALDPARPLENFIFDVRESHCELFASALTVMLRTRDIPSRVVSGYRAAEWLEESETHLARFKNAHAWVEAFIPGRGWITLDPTPGREGGPADAWRGRAPAERVEEVEEDLPWSERILEFDRRDQYRLAEMAEAMFSAATRKLTGPGAGLATVLIVTGIAFLATMSLVPRLRRRKRAGERGPAGPRPMGPGGNAVRKAYRVMLGHLSKRGIRRTPAETPREVARRAVAALPEAADPIRKLTILHQTVCYGDRAAEREDAREAGALAKRVKILTSK
jgi:transglutaminase-like putative cysteine protease